MYIQTHDWFNFLQVAHHGAVGVMSSKVIINTYPFWFYFQAEKMFECTMDAKQTTLVARPWAGYSWQLEEFKKDGQLISDPNNAVPAEMGELDIKSIKLLIGRLDHNDQCFLYLKSNIVYKGHVLAKQDIALLLKKE